MANTKGLSPNLNAFLDALAWSEGTSRVPDSDDGYQVLVGGTLFQGYEDHPRKLVWLPRLNINSTAAGRYQVLERYFDAYSKLLKLEDFTPSSQDAIAIQQIKESHALDLIESGDFAAALGRCSHIWASLPGAGYSQHENKLPALQQAYIDAGGTVA